MKKISYISEETIQNWYLFGKTETMII